MTRNYGQRFCASCGHEFTAETPNAKYCHYKCNRREAGRKWRAKPASDNWKFAPAAPTSQPNSDPDQATLPLDNPPEQTEQTPQEPQPESMNDVLGDLYGKNLKRPTHGIVPATETDKKDKDNGKD